ncbi:TIGR04282 family arsenosugar biosynthesis glycosyltransferase [Dasania marina]|uniref:TIGR04282 family arsenosugar biosynthesis glycosyltransferase n=1 Tax=Dasania marina TaxID=471499 RepID=UPI00037E4228|nr:TIGR04282 family arsenosugar biosynthesis glycosyltransferase [Dasania marina]
MGEFVYPRCKILVFAKAPVAGQVKTRMQPQLSPAQSAQLHKELLGHCLTTLQQARLAPVQLCYSGEHECWQGLRQRYCLEIVEQGKGDLGQRMAGAAVHALVDAEAVLLLGADCPFIDAAYIAQALQRLQQGVDVVFGPAEDGGYVLLGFKRLWPQLFSGISWGSDQVLAQSCSALKGVDSRYHCLAPLADIDRPEDLPLLRELPAFKHW